MPEKLVVVGTMSEKERQEYYRLAEMIRPQFPDLAVMELTREGGRKVTIYFADGQEAELPSSESSGGGASTR